MSALYAAQTEAEVRRLQGVIRGLREKDTLLRNNEEQLDTGGSEEEELEERIQELEAEVGRLRAKQANTSKLTKKHEASRLKLRTDREQLGREIAENEATIRVSGPTSSVSPTS